MKASNRLEVVLWETSKLLPYGRNARTHSEEQVKHLAESIKTFGFTNPVLITKEGRIIAGHGRVQGAILAGQEKVPCIVLKNLSDAQIQAYTIADNQSALMAGWDYDVLAAEIEELRDGGWDIADLGFTKDELDELLGSPDIPSVPDDKEEEKAPKDTTICPRCNHEFVI